MLNVIRSIFKVDLEISFDYSIDFSFSLGTG